MVEGLDLFRDRFREFDDAFVLIGGVACHEWFAQQGVEFRATKDLDIVLIVEAVAFSKFPRSKPAGSTVFARLDT